MANIWKADLWHDVCINSAYVVFDTSDGLLRGTKPKQ